MKRSKMIVAVASVVLGFAVSAAAQDGRSQISIQAMGAFTKNTESEGITYEASRSAGVLVGYSYRLNRLFGVEGSYGATLNTQKFTQGLSQTSIESDVHQVTGALVLRVPTYNPRIRPYVLGGGGFLVFNPTDLAPATESQTRGTMLYGGGLDLDLTHHMGVRMEYRGLIYKAPDFDQAAISLDHFTHVAEPSAGLFFRF